MIERTSLLLLVFSGLIFVLFIMMLISVLPKQTVVFTDVEEEEKTTGIQAYDPVFGSKDAPIVITHYSDFLCETCADVAQSIQTISEEYPDEIAIVWKDFPNVYAHPLSPTLSLAARCAGKQDSFWEYHDLLFAYQRELTEETASDLLEEMARELDLGIWRFNRCMNRQQTFEDMESSYQDAIDLELISAPTIDVNGERYTGIISENEIRSVILNLNIAQ